ncbi:hypothetical protein ACOSP7_026946 [Xanthoceras sorbifolium]
MEEKKGGVDRLYSLITNFRSALVDCDLGDLGFRGDCFTWCNGRCGDGLIQERLDRFVGNIDWRMQFPVYTVTHLEYWGSDHRPVLIDFCDSLMQGVHTGFDNRRHQHRFHLEDCWEDYPACGKIVQRNWQACLSTSTLRMVASSINKCASVLKGWNYSNLQFLRRNVTMKRQLLQQMSDSGSNFSWTDIQSIERQLNGLLSKEEMYWRQRSRNNWLKDGDRNTRFFHLSASSRCKRNRISGLLNSDNNWRNLQFVSAKGLLFRIRCF